MNVACFLPILFVFSICFGEKYTRRKIQKHFPDIRCGDKSMPIIHVTATNEANKDDVIHYVFSTVDNPTIIIKHEMEPSELKLNISNICNRTGEGVSFTSGSTSHLSGMILSKVFSYDDVQDDIFLRKDTLIGKDIVSNLVWRYDVSNDGDDENIKFSTKTKGNGSMEFSLRMYNTFGNSHIPPRNPINGNLTEFRLVMSNLPLDYKHTRYAVEVLFFSTDGSVSDATHTTTQYIDDEYTPGIFEMWAVQFLKNLPKIQQTFVTWKPVSYHAPSLSRPVQGLVKKFSEEDGAPVNTLKNPMKMYAGDVPYTLIKSASNVQYYAMNVTYGLAKDGFLNANNYLSWSGMVGAGIAPVDVMSKTATIVLSVGLGSPAVVILIGSVYVFIKQMQKSSELNYDEIN